MLCAGPVWAEAELIGSYHWQMDDARLGGMSAISLAANGTDFTALSDRGHLFTGRLIREAGQIIAVEAATPHRWRGPGMIPLSRPESDSEGLAIAPDGTIFIAFEWTHGIRRFATPASPAGPFLRHPDFGSLQTNSGLEALAIGPDGALYAIPERSGEALRPFPVYRYLNDTWDIPFSLQRRGAFLVVGADVGPDGRLYVLERDFIGVGFRSRVRRVDLDGGNETLILETGLRTHDNLEGISVWHDGDALRLTMISDDNFRSFQRTEIVEYRLTED